MIPPVIGLPGLRTAVTASARVIFKGGRWDWVSLPSGQTINGTLSRDSGNTGFLGDLRAGLLMGKVTATGLYAPAILGVTTGAYTSGGTSITVSAAQATEIVRRVGATGNLQFVGPPTANGTNAVSASKAYSAINTTTGVITTADIGADKVAGTLVVATDGTGTPLTVIPDGYPVKVTDSEGTSTNVSFAKLPIGGTIIAANLLPAWPSDTSLQSWIEASLNAHGQFVFDNYYQP